MCWVALDRAIKAQRALGLPGDTERWKAARATIREDILEKGYDEEREAFVQAYGNKNLDASNLLLPLLGFIKADDKRMESTIEGIARELTSPQGFVYRYRNYDDGLTGGESPFLICTYWLADNFILLGQMARARELFDRARACANDLGLYGEQYEPRTNEILGNFPQAFSHLAFITTAVMLHEASSPEHKPRKRRRS
jgi:GH15 family glucan-1,4-alpha-glucosidase